MTTTTSEKMFDVIDALEWLREAVDRRGTDYVYVDDNGERAGKGGECIYYSQISGEPACLVGHALHAAGLITYSMVQQAKCNARASVHELARRLGLPLTFGAIDVLRVAQKTQDIGGTWGQALRDAEAVGRL